MCTPKKLQQANRKGPLSKNKKQRFARSWLTLPLGVGPGEQGLMEGYDKMSGRPETGSYSESKEAAIDAVSQRPRPRRRRI